MSSGAAAVVITTKLSSFFEHKEDITCKCGVTKGIYVIPTPLFKIEIKFRSNFFSAFTKCKNFFVKTRKREK